MERPFKVTLRVVWWMQILQMLVAILCTILSISMLVSALRREESPFIFLFFASFAYVCWANALSTIQITDESVTVSVFYGRFRISWHEVELVALNYPLLALIGEHKRVVLSLAFAGKAQKQLLEYFHQQIEQRKIQFEEGTLDFPITHQNSRVWR